MAKKIRGVRRHYILLIQAEQWFGPNQTARPGKDKEHIYLSDKVARQLTVVDRKQWMSTIQNHTQLMTVQMPCLLSSEDNANPSRL